MKAFQKPFRSILFSAVLILSAASMALAGMTVFLKDGRVIQVPVNRDDVLGISFEEGTRPSAGNITWNFESGDLNGWVATGDAFSTQPTYGDNPTARHRGQPSNHEGNYWIGGYENRHRPADPPGRIQGDGPQGTLTSEPFTITRPTLSFLIGGGCDMNTERVELIVNGQAVLKATGHCTETMIRVKWNVSAYQGQLAQIRLIDASGGGWGHINFDDVRFE